MQFLKRPLAGVPTWRDSAPGWKANRHCRSAALPRCCGKTPELRPPWSNVRRNRRVDSLSIDCWHSAHRPLPDVNSFEQSIESIARPRIPAKIPTRQSK